MGDNGVLIYIYIEAYAVMPISLMIWETEFYQEKENFGLGFLLNFQICLSYL